MAPGFRGKVITKSASFVFARSARKSPGLNALFRPKATLHLLLIGLSAATLPAKPVGKDGNLRYSLTVLPDFQAVDMNEKGEVLGMVYDNEGSSSSAVIWSKGALRILPKPAGATLAVPCGLNEWGQIAGSYHYGTIDPETGLVEYRTTAFVQSDAGAIREILPESLSASAVSAQDINNVGQVLLGASFPDGRSASYILSGGVRVPVKGLGGIFSSRKINDLGQVLGESADASGRSWGFLFTYGHTKPLISPFGGDQSYALGLNNLGQATGAAFLPPSEGNVFYQAYIYRFGIVQPIPTLSETYSQGESINALGHVVGAYYNAEGLARGFIYLNGRTLDLGEQLKNAAGWQVTWAYAINSAGQILASASDPDGYWHNVILTPERR